jgi:hypothetical protein
MAADPVEVDPKHYRVEFENDRVRVLRVKFGPHEKSVMHGHPAGISISLTNRDLKFALPNGRVRHLIGRPGEVVWYDAHEHLPENLSSQPYEGIHIELKR